MGLGGGIEVVPMATSYFLQSLADSLSPENTRVVVFSLGTVSTVAYGSSPAELIRSSLVAFAKAIPAAL